MKVAVYGATGYVGQELVRMLLTHPEVEIVYLNSINNKNKDYYNLYGQYFGITNLKLVDEDIEYMSRKVDLIFLALPNGHGMKMIKDNVLNKVKIIDLSADFRLKNLSDYNVWYNITHTNKELLAKATYGLPEWYKENIENSNLIANPGCYVTCSLLSLLPLIKEGIIEEDIIIDAKSGVSGAGKSLSVGTHYAECNESLKAYKVGSHRHTPEIEEILKDIGEKDYIISFTPHLVPMNRGILATSYCRLTDKFSEDDIRSIYLKYYETEKFIRILPKDILPETKWVKGSNYCDIGFKLDERVNRLIVIGAIDNLVKGASGQAIQNMNIMFGFEETLGIKHIPVSI